MKRKTNNSPIAKSRTLKSLKLTTVLLLIFAVALSGCIGNEQNNTDNGTGEPGGDHNASEEEYIYGMANVESIDILTLESFPVQIHVIAEGYLPDGCTEIDEIENEREGNNFDINITTKRPRDAMCTQAIRDFNRTIPLDVQGLSAGNYTVNVNGITGSFELAVDNTLEEAPVSMSPGQQAITEANN